MKNKKIMIIIGICAIVAIILIAIIVKNNKTTDIEESKSFFLKNDEGKYALFGEDGKRKTDFIFTEANDFFNKLSCVKNDKGQEAVIDENGKYFIRPGKHDYISQAGSLFAVDIDDDFNYKVINSKKQNILQGGLSLDVDILDYISYITAVSDGEKTKIVDYDGRLYDTYNEDYGDAETAESDDNIVAVACEKKVYVYNLKTRKKLCEFEPKYEISRFENINVESSDEYNAFAIKLSRDDEPYRIYRNNKLLLTLSTDECDGGFEFYKNGFSYELDNKDGRRVVDNKGKEIVDEASIIIDGDSYVKEDSDYITFYDNNKETKKFSKKDYKDVWEAEYNDVIIMVSDDTEEYYNIKGERLNKANYVDVTSFNDEGYAIVSEDEENYYAINKDFQKVTDEYNNIKMINGKNWIVKRDGKNYLLKENENKIEEGFTEYIHYDSYEQYYILDYDNSCKIFDAEKGKIVMELDVDPSEVTMHKHYVLVRNDEGLADYYSYANGKKFFTTKMYVND